MTTEQTKSAYQRVCKQECELCAKGVTRTENGVYYHRYGKNGCYAGNCTAPSKEAFMERQAAQIEAFRSAYIDPEVSRLRKEMAEQAAQIAAMQAALAKASHHRDCNTNGLICKNCDKWFREHGIATDACPDRNSVFEEVRGCNCYLSTLSDDIERGKELLGAEDALGNLIAVIHGDGGHYQSKHGSRKSGKDAEVKYINISTQVDELAYTSQRQAVEIEELRRLLAATVSTVSRRTDAMIEAYNAVPVEGDDETPAAMKEKP